LKSVFLAETIASQGNFQTRQTSHRINFLEVMLTMSLRSMIEGQDRIQTQASHPPKLPFSRGNCFGQWRAASKADQEKRKASKV